MVRKSLVAIAAAMSLVAASTQAAPLRLASPMAESEGLEEDDAWILPVAAIAFVILIMLFEGDDDDDEDIPTSP